METQEIFADTSRGSQVRESSMMSNPRGGNMNNSVISTRTQANLYESMTIKKQYTEYLAIKDETFKKA